MMFPESRLVHNNQRGFTLIELIIAIAIAALITGGITAAIMQLLTINTRDSNHMVAVRQVQQAGKEVSKDTLQAQGVNATGAGWGLTLNLAWDEWGTNQTHTVNYTLVNGPGGVVGLQRSHSVAGNSTVTTVAEYIDPTQTSCVWAGGVLTFTVTATVGTQSETRTYQVEPRPSPSH
jgi:prepilin-type N-terminal cleavage/methylation domain-containing protein